MPTFDLSNTPVRELNSALHRVEQGRNDVQFEILNPRGHHAIAVELTVPSPSRSAAGRYYCAGMNDGGDVTILGSAGPRCRGKHDVGKGRRGR